MQQTTEIRPIFGPVSYDVRSFTNCHSQKPEFSIADPTSRKVGRVKWITRTHRRHIETTCPATTTNTRTSSLNMDPGEDRQTTFARVLSNNWKRPSHRSGHAGPRSRSTPTLSPCSPTQCRGTTRTDTCSRLRTSKLAGASAQCPGPVGRFDLESQSG